MSKHLLAVVAVATVLASYVPAGGETPASAPATMPTSRPTELAAKLIPEIQEVAKLDAPGAQGFAGALAGVLKKHSLNAPEALLNAKPSATLPSLTEEQVRSYSSQTVMNLLGPISYASPEVLSPAEWALRLDLLEAFCQYAPSMALRLQAADYLLKLASPGGNPPSTLLVDPHRAVEAARMAVTESLAAARDGRDTLSMKTLVGTRLVIVSTTMVGIDLLNLKELTKESLEKARKQWDEQFAALEKDAKDDESKKGVALIRKYYSAPFTDAQVDAMLLPGQCKPVAEAFFKALEKRDRDALKGLLTPTTAAKLAGKDVGALVKEMFGGTPRQIRLLSIGGLHSGGGEGEGFSVPCNVLWVDEEGKEHTARPEIHIVKTDKGWLVGEK
jgi:hypothetical protein